MKKLLAKSTDHYMALMSYRATPLPWCNLSPAELLMGRRIRTTLPLTDECLIPKWSYLQKFRKENDDYKRKQKRDFDKRHRVNELPMLSDDTAVWVTSQGEPVEGRIVSSADALRSYNVDTPSGQLRRNRHHLTTVPDPSPGTVPPRTNEQPEPPRKIMTRSQTETPICPPEKLA